jgi:hypothetical protein
MRLLYQGMGWHCLCLRVCEAPASHVYDQGGGATRCPPVRLAWCATSLAKAKVLRCPCLVWSGASALLEGCKVLAACRPRYGSFRPYGTQSAQFLFPPPLDHWLAGPGASFGTHPKKKEPCTLESPALY